VRKIFTISPKTNATYSETTHSCQNPTHNVTTYFDITPKTSIFAADQKTTK